MFFGNREHALPLRRFFVDVLLVLFRPALASKSEVGVFEGVEAAVGTTAVVGFVR